MNRHYINNDMNSIVNDLHAMLIDEMGPPPIRYRGAEPAMPLIEEQVNPTMQQIMDSRWPQLYLVQFGQRVIFPGESMVQYERSMVAAHYHRWTMDSQGMQAFRQHMERQIRTAEDERLARRFPQQ
jgi:hypothetical protein